MVEPRQACFVRVHPPLEDERLAVVPFLGARMTFGRGPESSVRLDLPGIAPRHLRVERVRGREEVRVQRLDSGALVRVDGRDLPARGADLAPGGLLRAGDALFVHRRWTEAQLRIAALPPLPGPLDTRYPPLVEGLHRLQRRCGTGDALWVVGEPGSGCSVALDHLRHLSATASLGERLVDGGGQDVRAVRELPEGVPEDAALRLPPLRERREDLEVLIRRGLPDAPPLGPDLLEALLLYDWPGNVQELRVALRRFFDARYEPAGEAWTPEDFPDVWRAAEQRAGAAPPSADGEPRDPAALAALRAAPGEVLRARLAEHRWALGPTADALGVSRAALLGRMAQLRVKGPLDEPEEDPADTLRRFRLTRAGGL